MLRYAVMLMIALPLAAQTFQANFEALAAKAKSKTEINVDQATLAAMGAKLPEAAKGLQALSIHTYEYEKAGDYPAEVLEALRKQVAADPRWSKLLSAREREESTDIYIQRQDGKLTGLLLIAAEADEVTIIQTEGTVEVAKLQEVVKSAIQYDIASAGNVGK